MEPSKSLPEEDNSSGNIPNNLECPTLPSISVLIDDVVIIILSFLNLVDRIRAERVCKQWKRCVQHAFKWQAYMALRREDFLQTRWWPSVPPTNKGSIKGYQISPHWMGFQAMEGSILCKILPRCSHRLTSIDVSNLSHELDNTTLVVIGKHCPSLKHLVINGSSIEDLGMSVLSSSCPVLKRLIARQCKNVSDMGFAYLFQNCRSLEHLDCSRNENVTGECLKFASESFQELHAHFCTALTIKGLMHLSTKCPKINVLRVFGCKIDELYLALTNLFQSCHQLKELDIGILDTRLSRPQQLHKTNFLDRVWYPSTLTMLNVMGNELCDQNLRWISSRCPNLCQLNIGYNPELTDMSVSQLSGLTNLQILNVAYLSKITEASLMGVVDRGILLELSANGCPHLGDELFVTMSTSCRRLENLSIHMNKHVSMKTVKAFEEALASDSSRKMTLTMKGISKRAQQDIMNMVGHCSRLKVCCI